MEFRIADTFTHSLGRLTGDEQKAVKTTAFDLQIIPANPGMNFHRLDNAKDKNFWSVRVNRDIRIIVHKSESSLMLCYVDHHDKAYEWAERRRLATHPTTGAAQLVEIRETVKEVFIPLYQQANKPFHPVKPRLFSGLADEIFLKLGVPVEWLSDVREATEDSLLLVIEHLPGEAGEALLSLAVGETPQINEAKANKINPFEHPDARRRFRLMKNMEELERALDFPWDKWAVFLHPDQRQWVEAHYSGPARVVGSAGTGKTVVALHRAVFLARANPEARILLTTFSWILANSLLIKLRRLVHNEPRLAERIEIYPIDQIGKRLFKANIGSPAIASPDQIKAFIEKASLESDAHKFSLSFLVSEWEEVVDAWQLKKWEDYRDVKRLGRKTRLPEQQRLILWSIFSKVNELMKHENLLTYAGLFGSLASLISTSGKFPFDYAVIDEAQDLAPYHIQFLSALGGDRANALFFVGDLGQRIFRQPFSWKSVGVDVRGRVKTLKINYRTSHQIRKKSDLLLGQELTDADGNVENRRNTFSVFNGPQPLLKTFSSPEDEVDFVKRWMLEIQKEGIKTHEIGIFVRSTNELDRAIRAAKLAAAPFKILGETIESTIDEVSICTMHLAKGLEFKAVVVMACDDEVIPLQERVEGISDSADLEEVYNTERHLLYVACTRARDRLLLTSVEPASEFLADMAPRFDRTSS